MLNSIPRVKFLTGQISLLNFNYLNVNINNNYYSSDFKNPNILSEQFNKSAECLPVRKNLNGKIDR